jgi:hypothetical protein
MRWLIFGIALIIAAGVLRMLPRYEMTASGTPGAVIQMDKWTGATRLCATDKCAPWVGGTGP